MLLEESIQFNIFLLETFQDGIYKRELRLSEKEIQMVRKTYPKARIKRIAQFDEENGKSWYEVDILYTK